VLGAKIEDVFFSGHHPCICILTANHRLITTDASVWQVGPCIFEVSAKPDIVNDRRPLWKSGEHNTTPEPIVANRSEGSV
jgi:hypothetical protein